jgi:hypothetical protein
MHRQLSPEVIAAWMACDYRALHSALGLSPAHVSPLPYEITVLGVSDDDFDQHRGDTIGPGPFSRSLKKAVKLQRQLFRVAGYPRDARRALEENLANATRDRDLAREQIAHPPSTRGTGCDPQERQERLETCEGWVAYYLAHLNGLADMRAGLPATRGPSPWTIWE